MYLYVSLIEEKVKSEGLRTIITGHVLHLKDEDLDKLKELCMRIKPNARVSSIHTKTEFEPIIRRRKKGVGGKIWAVKDLKTNKNK